MKKILIVQSVKVVRFKKEGLVVDRLNTGVQVVVRGFRLTELIPSGLIVN